MTLPDDDRSKTPDRARPRRATRYFRVDPRLVHATMMNMWVPTTGAKVLLVGDAKLLEDNQKRTILEMSAMGLVDVVFVKEIHLATQLAKCDPEVPVIVLFSTIEGALRASKSGLEIDRLNVGHVPEGEGRKEMHPAVHLGPAEFDLIDALQARDVEVFIQPLPNDKIAVIPRKKQSDKPAAKPSEPAKIVEKLRVVNERGLHLRAAHVFAGLAGKLPCAVSVRVNGGRAVNAKSLLGLTTLAATCGSMVEVTVEGVDAAPSMDQVRDLFAGGFGEGVDWVDDGSGR